jgi:hypothetical protein
MHDSGTTARRRASTFRRFGWLAAALLVTLALVGPGAAGVAATGSQGDGEGQDHHNKLTIVKVFVAPVGWTREFTINEFTINYVCEGDSVHESRIGTTGAVTSDDEHHSSHSISGHVHLHAGDSKTIDREIPVGYKCTVTESSFPHAPHGYHWVTPVVAGDGTMTADGLTVTVTNSLDKDEEPPAETGDLTITKDVTGASTDGLDLPDFSIHYTCGESFVGDVSLADGGSATIHSIPAKATCTVTEPTLPTLPARYEWGTPSVAGDGTMSEAGLDVTVTNPLIALAPRVGLQKIIVGGSATYSDFTFKLTSEGDLTVPGSALDGAGKWVSPDLSIGSWSITETGTPANYVATYEGCSGSVALGDYLVGADACVITNTYNPPATFLTTEAPIVLPSSKPGGVEGATATPAPPAATPPGDVAGATSKPNVTPPPTATLPVTGTPTGDTWRIALLAIAALLASILLLTPASPVRSRRRR